MRSLQSNAQGVDALEVKVSMDVELRIIALRHAVDTVGVTCDPKMINDAAKIYLDFLRNEPRKT